MIWELMKRDPAWQVMPFVALMIAGPALFVLGRSGSVYFLLTVPFIMAIGIPGFRQRSTLFQATLPIRGRQLFLSRLGSLMGCTWVPILSAVAATAALRRDLTWADRLPLIEGGAVMTVAILSMHCVRAQTINPPAWLVVVVYAGMFSPLFMLGEFFLPQPTATAIAVLGGCALASAALLLKAWAGIPKSFQLAPAEPASTSSGEAKRPWPAARWWVVLHSLYGWQASLSLFVIFGMMLMGMGGFPSMVLPAFFVSCRFGLRWLLHLPIPARKLFWAVWSPITVAMIAGFLVNIPFDQYQLGLPAVLPKTRLIAFVVALLSWLTQICFLQLQRWKRVRGIPLSVRTILSLGPSFAIFVAPLFLGMASTGLGSRNPALDALGRSLAGVLPDNFWMVAMITATPLAGLCWLAEKLFCEMEFGQIGIQARHNLARESV